MVMGKGGVGKTTIAAAMALGLVQRGHDGAPEHDRPGGPPGRSAGWRGRRACSVDRIDPKAETERYIDKIMAAQGHGPRRGGPALLLEDLRSPCTEEVAVFHAFSRIVSRGAQQLRRAGHRPTGHTLLLMDADRRLPPADDARPRPRRGAGGCHAADAAAGPGLDAGHPGDPGRDDAGLGGRGAAGRPAPRAGSSRSPGWSTAASPPPGPSDPVLAARARAELAQIARVQDGLARRMAIVPWCATPPVGRAALHELVGMSCRRCHETVTLRG